ncbi:MAG: ATP-dependent helicase, partial [Lachnospiraceae bacterium]|nr:ATP-dependent helicase [Lachnospiraceae bacterium]
MQPLSFLFTQTAFRTDDRVQDLGDEAQRWKEQFEKNRFKALFQLGFENAPEQESMSFSFLRMVSEQFLDALCALPELELARADVKVNLQDDAAEQMLSAVPYGIGTEYITRDWLENIFHALNDIFSLEISSYDGTVAMFLAEKSQRLRVPERVFFHLVENTDDTAPFAFLATYATTDKKNRIRHMPLQYALTEYQNSRENLVALLSCLNRAAEDSAFVGSLMESGEMFHPLRLTTEEAYSFLKDI